MNAIDTASDVRPHLPCLQAQGVIAVGRYACKSTGIVGKKLEPIEAQAIAAAGLSIFTAWEQGDAEHVTRFTTAQGTQDASDFLAWAAGVGQPEGSAVYPTIDFEATPDDLAGPIRLYFEAFAIRLANAATDYRLGVYGSWRTCRTLLDSGLVALTWLAGATGWAEYEAGSKSGLWTIRQQSGAICGLPSEVTDLDDVAADFGGWVPVGTGGVSQAPTA